jgi:mRNA interferase MazF
MTSRRSYVPEQGDIVSLEVHSRVDRRDTERLSALVISPAEYNRKTSLLICCPIAPHTKGYPFEVPVRAQPSMDGVVLADQVKSLEWEIRKARRMAKATSRVLQDTVTKLRALLNIHPSPD